jgi:NADPH:quinone reductase-like Zn-dependent oxidoreductase
LKAVRIHVHGGIDQLRYENADDPELRSGDDVIVRLKAAALNRVDLELRAGAIQAENSLPRILGVDGAGVVVAVGADAQGVKPGDAVCLYPFNGCGRRRSRAGEPDRRCDRKTPPREQPAGTYAEYVRVPVQDCCAIPVGLSFEEAAAFPLAYGIVWRMLSTHAGLKPAESVLIVGAGGGVASAALQIAGAMGARVFVTSADEEKLCLSKNFGAAQVIHCRTAEFAKAVRGLTDKRGVDVIVNCVGGPTWAESLAALARGGRMVTCGAVAGAQPRTDLRRVFWNHLKIFAAQTASRQEFLHLSDFLVKSKLKPVIDTVFPLQDAQWAHRRLEEGRQFGKIVLRIAD